MSALYRFGPFELNTDDGILTRNGNRVKLQDLPYRLLLVLLEQPGRIVSRETVRQRLWPENTFVEFDNSLGVAVRKIRDGLGDNAEAPKYIETLPRRGYRFLAPVTVIGGALPVADQAKAPEKVIPVPPTAIDARHSRPLSLYLFLASAAVLMTAVAIYGVRSAGTKVARQATPAAVAPVRMRRSVAVIGFRNLPGHPEDAWLSAAFAEMLDTELAEDGALRLVSGEDIARAKRELPLSEEDSLAAATLERLRTDPGADVVVLGSYTPLPGRGQKRIRLDVRLQDTARGETIAEHAFVGGEDDLFELVGQAGASLRQSLGSTPVSGEASAQARAALPTKPQAVKLYTEGQASLWNFDFVRARTLLIQAVAVEPDFPLSHAALSDTWAHLGYSLKARNESERAKALAGRLSPEERLLVDALYYSAVDDSKKAIEVYTSLFEKYPDNLGYGLRLADLERWVNPDLALATLTSLRHLPAPSSDDPRIDILEARAWVNRDQAKAQAAGRSAVEKGKAQGAHLLVARAYGVLCQIDGDGGSPAQTTQDCDNARQGYAAAGDRDNEARTVNDFATWFYQHGDLDRSEAMFKRAIQVFRGIGDIEGISTTAGNLGDIEMAKANLAAASRDLNDALPGYKEMGDQDGIALVLNDLGEIARRRGDLDEALKTYQQAQVSAQEIDDKRALAYTRNGIGDVLVDRGDLANARKAYEESLRLRKQSGSKQATAETELSLARLSIEEGHSADSESVIRKCKEQFHQDQQADDELAASTLLAADLIAQSKFPEALNEINGSNALASKSVNEILHLQLDLVCAQSFLASGKLDAARTRLMRILQKANSFHLVELEFETRLAMAGLKRKSGKVEAAQTELIALEKVARAKGFNLIAGKALADRNNNEKGL